MRESQWLKMYEKEQKGKREKSNQSKKGDVYIAYGQHWEKEDYLGKKYMAGGHFMYSFIRRSDIAAMNYCKTASTTANPLRAAYFKELWGILHLCRMVIRSWRVKNRIQKSIMKRF